MKSIKRILMTSGLLFAVGVLVHPSRTSAQGGQTPGHPIGKITTQGDLIIMELDEGVIPTANLFDLSRHTLRFTKDGTGYRAENLPVEWDSEFGTQLTGAQVVLHNFTFPFSGKTWDTLSVGQTGSITFVGGLPLGARAGGAAGAGARAGAPAAAGAVGGRGAAGGQGGSGRGGGVTIDRFAQLREAASTIMNTVPAICVFMKPRMTGQRYVKELADRVVITWTLTEPSGGIFDFTWVPTVNRFQAVLRRDGSIDLSYDQLAAQDAIVGIYPVVNAGVDRPIATVTDAADAKVAAHLDLRSVKVSTVDGLFLKVTFETRGPVLPEGDPQLAGVTYRVHFDADKPFPAAFDTTDDDVVWTIRGGAAFGRGGGGGGGGAGGRGAGGGGTRYTASGPGVSPAVKMLGNTISLQGTLPAAFTGVTQVALSADVVATPQTAPPTPAPTTSLGPQPSPLTPSVSDQAGPRTVTLSGIWNPSVDLSAATKTDGPYPILYEGFHFAALPRTADMACTVIRALGDKFDFFAWYSDFRVDNQEAGTPSTGPRGGNVTGIGEGSGRGQTYCSDGRLQWQFVQPVYIGSNQGQERSPDGRITGYNLGMSQIGHELGHRWTADATAKVGAETIPLGPTHWARGLQAPAAFPYRRPTEASAMGGGVWQDNYDGTFTQLDDDFFVPATGYSHLDLYLMGFISAAEVPDFFILRNLVRAGSDARGRPIYRGDRTTVTIQDVIASLGPRVPAVEDAQKKFNTGIVAIVLHGATPSRELIERANGLGAAWVDYWATITGHRASMTTVPR
jgi:hypothetical protein